MKILVLNCGSSSIKYKLFDMTTKEVMAQVFPYSSGFLQCLQHKPRNNMSCLL